MWFALAVLALLVWRVAVVWTNGYGLTFDEAQYWVWSKDPAFGYISKPPAIAWLIAGTTALCGDAAGCVRLGAAVFHPLTAIVVALIGARLFGRTAGIWCGILYLLAPAVAFSSMIVSTDVILLLFWALALYAFIRALDEDGWAWWLLLGVATGAGLLSKYAMGYFFPCALLFLLLSRTHRRWLVRPQPYAALLLALAIFAPNVLWNVEHGFMTVKSLGRTAAWQDGGYKIGLALERAGMFTAIQFAISGPVIMLGYVRRLIRLRRLSSDWRIGLLFALSLPIFLLLIVQALVSKAYGNWAVVGHIGALVLAVGLWIEDRWRTPIYLSLAIGLIASVAIHHYDAINRAIGVPALARFDPFDRFRGRADLGRQLGALAARFPNAVVLVIDREPAAEFAYHTTPKPRAMVKWNPTRVVHDHFDLSSDVRPYAKAGRDFLLLLAPDASRHNLDHFCQAYYVGKIRSRPHSGLTLEYDVYWLRGWRGFNWHKLARCHDGRPAEPPPPGGTPVRPPGRR